MNKNIKDLRDQILQKNSMLNNIEFKDDLDNDKVSSIKSELDSLLYQYYKLLKCG
jgi:hypothetical protein